MELGGYNGRTRDPYTKIKIILDGLPFANIVNHFKQFTLPRMRSQTEVTSEPLIRQKCNAQYVFPDQNYRV